MINDAVAMVPNENAIISSIVLDINSSSHLSNPIIVIIFIKLPLINIRVVAMLESSAMMIKPCRLDIYPPIIIPC
jgi:hypothetical protein